MLMGCLLVPGLGNSGMEKTNNIEVWGIGTLRCMRVHWVLQEFNLKYLVHPIKTRTGQANTEEYRKINPREKIPTLIHDSFVITESAAIVSYIADKFSPPANFYVPTNKDEQARILEWNFFVMTELDATALYVIRRHEGLPHIYGKSETAVIAAKEYFQKQISAMVPELLKTSGGFLCGNQFSIADIIMTTTLDGATNYGISLPPLWVEYLESMVKRPGYEKAFEITYPDGKQV